MIHIPKRFRILQLSKKRNAPLHSPSFRVAKRNEYYTLKKALFSQHDQEIINEAPPEEQKEQKEPIHPLNELYNHIGISLTPLDLEELGNIESLEDLKEVVFDTNLWLSIKISPVKKAKIKSYLKLTPIPLSDRRKQFLLSDSLDKVEGPEEDAVFPFDTPANDIDRNYALPLRFCGDSIDKSISALLSGKDTVLYGNDFKGKTTALWEIRDMLMLVDSTVLPLYIDLKKFSDGLTFDFTKALVHSLSATCGDFDAYDSLTKYSARDALERLSKQCSNHGKKLIILIDHIEDLNWTKQMEILIDALEMPRRAGAASSKPYSIMLAGTESMWKDLIFHDPNWNNYCHKELWNPAFLKSHIGALAKNIKLFHFPFDSKALTKIKNLTGGHPWYVNRLLQEIKEYIHHTRQILLHLL